MNPDPRATAYALGELDPTERDAFERELAASPTLQAEVQATATLSDHLMKTLPDPAAALTPAQRETLRARAAAAPKIRPRMLAWAGALAASLAVVLGLWSLSRPSAPARVAAAPPVSRPAAVPPPTPAPAEARPSNPALVAQLKTEARGFSERGSYDLAERRIDQVLALDRTDREAGVLKDQINLARTEYAANLAGQNEARTRMTLTVSTGYELPVRRYASGNQQPPAALSAGLAGASAASAGQPVGGKANGLAMEPGRPSFGLRKPANPNSESYAAVTGNVFLPAKESPLSTFSIDVDTASYANVRRFLVSGQLPPPAAVRLEELINYFPTALPQPESDAPFSVTTEVSRAPWNDTHLLARIALKGRDLTAGALPASNLVFLVDVSGSMQPADKLPLLQRALRGLVQRLTPRDRVAVVVYAGSSGLALPSTTGEDQPRILAAIDRLESGGSTNGGAGIQLAYATARKHFLADGNNRVILCTDGDFNVGVTNRAELTRLIERERKSGIFLSVLGFGTGNLQDATMESLADKGNGNYAYIDSPSEARKVLVEQMGATLFTIAKDVKIQVEFNPATVAGYRLIGYENRLLAKEDFNDDTKDAGEIGAGHSVTALYEIVPAGQPLPNDRTVDPLKYQPAEIQTRDPKPETSNAASDIFTVKLRFKPPTGDTSKLLEKVVAPEAVPFAQASDDFRFTSAVAAFGMKLRADANDPTLDWPRIQQIARGSLGEDPGAYRAEFLTLIEKARNLSVPDRE